MNATTRALLGGCAAVAVVLMGCSDAAGERLPGAPAAEALQAAASNPVALAADRDDVELASAMLARAAGYSFVSVADVDDIDSGRPMAGK